MEKKFCFISGKNKFIYLFFTHQPMKGSSLISPWTNSSTKHPVQLFNAGNQR